MSHTKDKRIRVKNLWMENPRCRRCNCLTFLNDSSINYSGKKQPANLATLDHVFCRLHPKRNKITPGEQRTTLLCYNCNQEKSREELAEFYIAHRIKSRKALESKSWLLEFEMDMDECFLK